MIQLLLLLLSREIVRDKINGGCYKVVPDVNLLEVGECIFEVYQVQFLSKVFVNPLRSNGFLRAHSVSWVFGYQPVDELLSFG